MKPPSLISRILIATMLSVAVVGCGESVKIGIVTGVVSKDGKPLDGVMVSFMPNPLKGTDGKMSRAVTDEQGRYRLSYTGEGIKEGAVVGWHLVTLEDFISENYRGPGRPPASRIPALYIDPSASPLSFEVQEGEQEIDLDVK